MDSLPDNSTMRYWPFGRLWDAPLVARPRRVTLLWNGLRSLPLLHPRSARIHVVRSGPPLQARDADGNPRLSGGDAIKAGLQGPLPYSPSDGAQLNSQRELKPLPAQQHQPLEAVIWDAHGAPIHVPAQEGGKQLALYGLEQPDGAGGWRSEEEGEVAVEVVDRGDGTYELTICTTAAGGYWFHVTVGEALRRSFCCGPTVYACVSQQAGRECACLGLVLGWLVTPVEAPV